jgi:Lrp/AsnC family transcriptional regulator for asnA, asnC and gidA
MMKLTAIDVGIMQCLQQDAPLAVAQIASRLLVPESTVRHRLNRLVQGKVLEFAAMTNPLEMGYQIWAVMNIQTDIGRLRAVAKRLAQSSEVYFVALTTGGPNVHIGAFFRSNEALLDFMTRRLSKIPGVISVSTSGILELIKRSVTVVLPPEVSALAVNGHARRARVSRRTHGPALARSARARSAEHRRGEQSR